MKIKLYPKDLLEAAWRQDKKLYADGDAAEPPQCLRCGAPLAAHLMVNALSRYVNVQICEACGMDEALRDAAHAPLPLTEWDAVKRGRFPVPAKERVCYLKTSCTLRKYSSTPIHRLCSSPASRSARSFTPARIMTAIGGGQPGTMGLGKRHRRSWRRRSTSSRTPCSSCRPSRRWTPCGGSVGTRRRPARRQSSTFIPKPTICISGFG